MTCTVVSWLGVCLQPFNPRPASDVCSGGLVQSAVTLNDLFCPAKCEPLSKHNCLGANCHDWRVSLGTSCGPCYKQPAHTVINTITAKLVDDIKDKKDDLVMFIFTK